MISVSGKFTLAALTEIRIWPGPGTGDGTSSITSVSGEPNVLQRTAFKTRSFLRRRHSTQNALRSQSNQISADSAGSALIVVVRACSEILNAEIQPRQLAGSP